MKKVVELNGSYENALSYLIDKCEILEHSKDGLEAFKEAIFIMNASAFGTMYTQKKIFDMQRYFFYDISMRDRFGKDLTVTEREVILKALRDVKFADWME